jgi:hypothetical protein
MLSASAQLRSESIHGRKQREKQAHAEKNMRDGLAL